MSRLKWAFLRLLLYYKERKEEDVPADEGDDEGSGSNEYKKKE